MSNYHSIHTGETIDNAISTVISKETTWNNKQDKITDVVDQETQGQFITKVNQIDGQISITRSGMDWVTTGGSIDDNEYFLHGSTGSIHKSRISAIWEYVKGKITSWCGIADNNQPVCSGTSTRLTIVKVSTLPANPDPNVIYMIG